MESELEASHNVSSSTSSPPRRNIPGANISVSVAPDMTAHLNVPLIDPDTMYRSSSERTLCPSLCVVGSLSSLASSLLLPLDCRLSGEVLTVQNIAPNRTSWRELEIVTRTGWPHFKASLPLNFPKPTSRHIPKGTALLCTTLLRRPQFTEPWPTFGFRRSPSGVQAPV